MPSGFIKINKTLLKFTFGLNTIGKVAGSVQRSLKKRHNIWGNQTSIKYVYVFLSASFASCQHFWKFLINSENKAPFPFHRGRVEIKDVSVVFSFSLCLCCIHQVKMDVYSCNTAIFVCGILYISSVQFSSVAQLCLTLCNPMDRIMPGLPVHH